MHQYKNYFFLPFLFRVFLYVRMGVLLGALTVFATPSQSDEPEKQTLNVVASIRPLHGIVSAVMQGVGKPFLLIKGHVSPHHYAMRPSDMTRLSRADILFWIDKTIETSLAEIREKLPATLTSIKLADSEGLTYHPMRKENHSSHDGHHDHHGHHDSDHDAHIWLDPLNAVILARHIARELSLKDPAHGKQYRKNAEAFATKIQKLTKKLTAELRPLYKKGFMTSHDSHQYFEKRFGLHSAGNVAINAHRRPGAARIRDVRNQLKKGHVKCLFSGPEFPPRLLPTLVEGTGVKTAILDPVGSSLPAGADFYPAFITTQAKAFKDCLQ